MAPRGVYEVVAADALPVAVPREHHRSEVRVERLCPRGEGDGPAVGRVQGVAVEVGARYPGPAPHALPAPGPHGPREAAPRSCQARPPWSFRRPPSPPP